MSTSNRPSSYLRPNISTTNRQPIPRSHFLHPQQLPRTVHQLLHQETFHQTNTNNNVNANTNIYNNHNANPPPTIPTASYSNTNSISPDSTDNDELIHSLNDHIPSTLHIPPTLSISQLHSIEHSEYNSTSYTPSHYSSRRSSIQSEQSNYSSIAVTPREINTPSSVPSSIPITPLNNPIPSTTPPALSLSQLEYTQRIYEETTRIIHTDHVHQESVASTPARRDSM